MRAVRVHRERPNAVHYAQGFRICPRLHCGFQRLNHFPGAALDRVTEPPCDSFRRRADIMAYLGHGRFDPAVSQHASRKIVDIGERMDGG